MIETYILSSGSEDTMRIPDDAPKDVEAGPKDLTAILCNPAGFLPCES